MCVRSPEARVSVRRMTPYDNFRSFGYEYLIDWCSIGANDGFREGKDGVFARPEETVS